ncbi:MAG: SGNH/GDSL hydrolase family protein, partial [Planctomycetes bacterium]|nr:SGNH/GDSL hydrolase family protein [Planctomycetota bacterium]
MFRRVVPLLALLVVFTGRTFAAGVLELRPGDRICLVGNALGERMQHHNYWEALLHRRFPEHELVVRNLCFPGDEPFARLRSLNFGEPDVHLAHSRASVILCFFGYNESFAGPAGLERFKADLVKLVRHNQSQNYSGDGPPRIVLISPIAFENTGDKHLPDGREHNERLAEYTQAMHTAAKESGVGFVDLFTPTKELFATGSDPFADERNRTGNTGEPQRGLTPSARRLTLNGAHLNESGYRALAPILDKALFGSAKQKPAFPEKLLAEIADKNFHWWHRYRAVNGYSIYGTRGLAGMDGTGTYNNRDVMERERAILDQMTANRDRRIWKVARGEPVPERVDDSSTLPFLNPQTNVGGTNDPNRK